MVTTTKSFVPDSQILANQANAKALGVTIPGLSKTTPTSTDTPTATYAGTNLTSYNPTDPYDKGLNSAINSANTAQNQVNDPTANYQNKLSQYQAQIDAVNQIYAQKLNTSRIEGQGRLGSGRAIEARSGTLGSDFASAQNDTITANNNDILSGISAEQAQAVQAIMGQARKDAADETAAKTLAKSQGGADYLKYLGEQNTRKASKFDEFLASHSGTDLSTINPTNLAEVAKSYGVSVDTLKQRVKDAQDAKIAKDAKTALDTAKTQSEIDKNNDKSFTLSEGQSYYGSDGKLVASKAKTYAPKSTPTYPSTTTDENGNVISTGNYDALTIGRYNRAANSATSILQKNPTFKNIIGASAYLDRIEAAIKNPGSVGDQELLDAFTQLNTGGNRVTEAQVHLITNNQSLGDMVQKFGNKLSTGGALSGDQRNEIVKLSNEVYKNYQKSYQPLYKDATSRLQQQGVPKAFWNIPDPNTLSRAVSDAQNTTNSAQPSGDPEYDAYLQSIGQ